MRDQVGNYCTVCGQQYLSVVIMQIYRYYPAAGYSYPHRTGHVLIVNCICFLYICVQNAYAHGPSGCVLVPCQVVSRHHRQRARLARIKQPRLHPRSWALQHGRRPPLLFAGLAKADTHPVLFIVIVVFVTGEGNGREWLRRRW